MNGSFIIAHTFSADVTAVLDVTASPSTHSMIAFDGSTWDTWSSLAISNDLPDGEWPEGLFLGRRECRLSHRCLLGEASFVHCL